ncbi:MAG TPA: hypothetical protein VFN75_02810 [Pseudonocardiaceae bacterium]|nr:hypothetical protein [Pseudonocardiaceae bacterium]
MLFGVAVLSESLSTRVLSGMVVVLTGVGLVRRGAINPPVSIVATVDGGSVVADGSMRPPEADRPPN